MNGLHPPAPDDVTAVDDVTDIDYGARGGLGTDVRGLGERIGGLETKGVDNMTYDDVEWNDGIIQTVEGGFWS